MSKRRAKLLKITQIKSSIGKHKKAKHTLKALGLGRIGKSKIHKNNPSIHGMLRVVKGLVKVEEIEDADAQ